MDVSKRAMMNVSGLDILGFFERAGGWFAAAVKALFRIVRKWNHNRRTRRDLLDMSDHMLKDIGISRAEAIREGRKPFWKD